jgi:cobalt-zinc-cadmium efflux system protein
MSDCAHGPGHRPGHGPGHHHHHGHAHHHGPSVPRGGDGSVEVTRRLRLALVLTVTLLVAEAVGGWLSNSLALLADAGHMLTDAGALALSLFVAWLARQQARPERTYGYLRWEILAALINGATLLLVSGWIVYEAVRRFSAPEPVAGGMMLVVALAGLVVNAIAAWLLHGAGEHSLNVRGAYLHVMGDLLSSVGTVVAALLISFTGWTMADPIASLLTTALIVVGAWRLVREAVDVLLESAPAHIPLAELRQRLAGIPGVESVHDLHVWTVTSGVVAMSAHAIVRDAEHHQEVLEEAHDRMRDMGVHHVTLQLERREMYDRELHLHP